MSPTEQAKEIIKNTHLNLFLTGRAGTGKTTFLKAIKEEQPKRMVVLAPTGVAAINAGGSTLHSFFQLPLGLYLPGYTRSREDRYKMSGEKLRIIRGLELLVIDEISMVRADLLDLVSDTLKRYRKNDLPFGGVQLLLIGDLQQLPPVVKDDEVRLLKEHYDSPYFFSSRALKETSFVSIELTHIYRQTDSVFINLLEKIRNKDIDEDTVEMLNSKFNPKFSDRNSEGYITLCTHHYKADRINSEKMDALPSPIEIYTAEITGNFPQTSFPVDEKLALKEGAQVMFAKNDPSYEKKYYNGKIGRVVATNSESVTVESDGEIIDVKPIEWSNMRYTIDEKTKAIKEIEDGTFTQIPLKLAWAITIHKSQGLTFDNVILDVNQAFAHGQVYVALSRCRSFDGLVLRSTINPRTLFEDEAISDFTESKVKSTISEEFLSAQKEAYLADMAMEQFDFEKCYELLQRLEKFGYFNFRHPYPRLYQSILDLSREFKINVYEVGKVFAEKVFALVRQHDIFKQKMLDGAAYFYDKVNYLQTELLQRIKVDLDSEAAKKEQDKLYASLKEELLVKISTLLALKNSSGFSVEDYLKVKGNVLMGDAGSDRSVAEKKSDKHTEKSSDRHIAEKVQQSEDIENDELFALLKEWRYKKAQEEDKKAFQVLHNSTLITIANTCPVTYAELAKIKGMGPMKLDAYAEELLGFLNEYSCR
ncbi:MAG: AAA family ATPase [Bacteroidales bacterium]|jgi:hypothetical protein|nr:AAA family ATPase [Bacteroidales bacterium]